jgi:hypothetical protein
VRQKSQSEAERIGQKIHIGWLDGLEDQIGFGEPDKPGPTRHWAPLPICESSTGGLASASDDVVGSYNPLADPSNDLKIFLKMFLAKVPEVGPLLTGLVDLLWPAGGDADTNLFKEIVEQETYDRVSNNLRSLYDLLMDPTTGWNKQVTDWQTYCLDPDHGGSFDSHDCVAKARDSLFGWFQTTVEGFTGTGGRRAFQQNETTDYRVDLLPLFVQFENLYMALLRDGVLLHEYWKERKDLDPDWEDLDSDVAWNAMAAELNPANTNDLGVAYVDKIFNLGLDQHPAPHDPSDWDHPFDYVDNWNTRLSYIRDYTLNVLDYRDTWKYMDPRAYPDGVPGGVKLTRMIYSDLVGQPHARPNLPSNVAGPLKEMSVWTKTISSAAGKKTVIGTVQATSPPLLGPAQSGAITGENPQTSHNPHYYSLSALGPIIKVDAQDALAFCGSTSIDFVFATGGESRAGDYCSNHYSQVFNYDDEVLATAHVISHLHWDNKWGDIADAFVFGFRYADSFNPAGELIGVGSGRCIRLPTFANGTQAEIFFCNRPPAPDQIWTYDPALQQISVTNPAEWSPNDPRQPDVSKHCLDSAGAWRSPVFINACDDGALTYDADGNPVVSSQRWTIDAVGAGIAKITHVKSGLVVIGNYTVPFDGAKLVLYPYSSGNPAHQWYAHDPLTGEIHSIGSGRCLDVPNYSTVPGTQVQIYDCKGNMAQQWAYDPTSRELIYAYAMALGATQPMCLEARGGGTSAGTAVQINTCTGASEQRWTLHGEGSTISNDKSGLVLDVKGGNTGNGTLVQLYTSSDTGAQKWSRTSTRGGALQSVAAGKCLDLPAWSNDTPAVIRICNSPLSAAQTWTYHPLAQTFTVDSPSGPKCLDATSGLNFGMLAVINDCTGAASQQWLLDYETKSITNVNTGWVLDLNGGGTADGTLVGLMSYVDGDTAQQWVWSLD